MTKKIILLFIGVALASVTWLTVRGKSNQIELSNAYFTGRILNITAPSEGLIDSVKVKKGDRVAKGDVLFTQESERDALVIDQRIQDLRSALAQGAKSCSDVKIAASALGNHRPALLDMPDTKRAIEGLKQAYYQRYIHQVKTPYDGYVYAVQGYPGLYARSGDPQITLVPEEQALVEANVLESELKLIKIGTKVLVLPDASENAAPLAGYIHSIVPSAAASFSKIPRNNIDSNWIKVAQRIPVLISLAADETRSYPIGTSARVIIPKESKESAPPPPRVDAAAIAPTAEPAWGAEYERKLAEILSSEVGAAVAPGTSRCTAAR